MSGEGIGIIIPCLNEAGMLQERLQALQPLRRAGHELILVDGGSDDGTPERARGLVDQCLRAPAGRASQMNHGAAATDKAIFWFLHLDSRLPNGADRQVLAAAGGGGWGRFDVRLSGRGLAFRVIERMMNLRSCLSGIATGDQGIFVHRSLFEAVAGFPPIPLMEDIALSRRLKRYRRARCVKTPIQTSSRRWERHGIVRTVLLMWLLRLGYFVGISPWRLARLYPPCSSPTRAS